MSSYEDDGSDADAEALLSPSAYLQALSSSQHAVEDAKPDPSQLIRPNEDHTSIPDEDDEYSDDERENRFKGPAITWHRYTAEERALAASLDQQRANDLSIHLFNAHSLKSRLYSHNLATQARPWQSKQTWMQPDETIAVPWHPDQSWTAWPLLPADVPRKAEAFGKAVSDDGLDNETWEKPLPWRPSRDLEGEVNAIMLRNAKEQFRRRTWATSETAKFVRPAVSRSRSASRTGSVRQSSVASSQAEHKSVDGQDTDVPDDVDTSQDLQPPAFMADDEEASRLLRPSVRHVVSKFDDLLIALHHNKQGHHASIEANPSSKVQKRKRRSATDDAVETGTSIKKEDHKRARRVKTVDRDYAKHPSGPHSTRTRDWSEVLGVASLTGWNPVVIERAAKRCASLFGETMSFRTMPETAIQCTADTLAEYRPETIRDVDLVSDEVDIEDVWVDSEDFICPEMSCPRLHQPFERKWRLYEHLKKKHGYSREDIDEFIQASTDATPQLAELETASRQPDDSTTDLPADLDNAVHEDGFMQPVSIKLRRGKDIQPRSRRGSRAPEDGLHTHRRSASIEDKEAVGDPEMQEP